MLLNFNVMFDGSDTHFLLQGFQNTRLNAMALLVSLWGLRLTYNFARKGGFTYDPSGKR